MNTASGTGAQSQPEEPIGQLLAEVLGLCDEAVALITDQHVEGQMHRVFDRLVEELAAELDAKTTELTEDTGGETAAIRDEIPAGTFHVCEGAPSSGRDNMAEAPAAGRFGC